MLSNFDNAFVGYLIKICGSAHVIVLLGKKYLWIFETFNFGHDFMNHPTETLLGSMLGYLKL